MTVVVAKRQAADAAPAAGRAPTALIADDDPLVRQHLRAALDDRFGVLEARDGREAIRLAQGLAAPPELAVVDIVMPVQCGLEAIAALRRLWPKTPLVALATDGPAHEELFITATRLGASQTLVKPFKAQAVARLAAKLAPA